MEKSMAKPASLFAALGKGFTLNGVTAVEVMGEVFVWLAPAGYVFGVWVIVYLALAVWAVRLVRDGHHARHLGAMPVGVEAALFAVSCLLGIVWLVLWHLRVFAVSALVIIVCTIIAVMLYVITRKRSNARWDWMPLSLYASWLAMVALVNVAHALTRSVTADMGLVPAISTFAVLIVLVLTVFFAFMHGRKKYMQALEKVQAEAERDDRPAQAEVKPKEEEKE